MTNTDNTPDTFQLQEPPMGAHLVTAEQWATAHGVALRSVRRYLQKGKLPTAVMEGGRWMIPLDAEVEHQAAQGTVVRQAPAAAPATTQAPRARATATMTLEGELGGQTAYLDLETASRLLGIPADVVVRHREEFGTVRYGDLDPSTRRRAWVVPASTVRAIAGLR